MNTLGDANALAVLFTLLSIAGAGATALGWNQNFNRSVVSAAKPAIYSMILLSLGVIALIAVMYFRTKDYPHYPFGLAPTNGEIKLAVSLLVLHVLNLLWMFFAHKRYSQQPSYAIWRS